MVGTHAGDMIGEIALAIEMAAEVAHGSCTDLPPTRRLAAKSAESAMFQVSGLVCLVGVARPFILSSGHL